MSNGKIYGYALGEGAPAPADIDRVGGEPIGMTAETWPLFSEEPMIHVLTIAAENIVHELDPSIAAVAVFTNEILNNPNYSDRNIRGNKVITLTREDLERGTTTAESVLGKAFEGPLIPARKIVVNKSEYDFDEIKNKEYHADSRLDELGEESISRAISEFMVGEINKGGGLSTTHTWWRQSPPPSKKPRITLFYFSVGLVSDINLGDNGVMYVLSAPDGSNGRALWQG